jgi:alpha-glucuronidase
MFGLFLLLACLLPLHPAQAAEDGYDLWLRYRPLGGSQQAALKTHATSIVVPARRSATAEAALAEIQRGLTGMLGQAAPLAASPLDGALVLATPASLKAWDSQLDLAGLGREGYHLLSTRLQGKKVTLIAANTDIGLLYGAFAWLRAVNTRAALDKLDVRSAPSLQLRVLNHWDNPDRSVERGYAGQSIWNWWELPDIIDSRYVDYARANASIGINGAVLNNVNASAEMLSAPFLAKAAALADVLRPYGIKVYLSVRFATPLELHETRSADPLLPEVAAWWQRKADEIYRAIPDFGGFLVKANSEGQPGPHDYRRSHADGANMLARALAPHGGVVMWRAFVYSEDNPVDRARQAVDQFKPLDGQFAPNVIVQVKNGAIDFQPHEPFHPMFSALTRTPLMMEFQITKEYLGFATHLAYLGSMYQETLESDTHVRPGATVRRILDGSVRGQRLTGMAGVANIGSARNWSGSDFDQANWYAFGRFAWNPGDSAAAIARDWIMQTFATDPPTVDAIHGMMMRSHQAVVDYMTPLGLHHLMGTGHHHGPAPWVAELARPEWNPVYYHRADRNGIGFDRTASGSNAISQYEPALAALLADPRSTPEQDLLWFHHLPWTYRMPSGRTLWAELIAHYDRGLASAVELQAAWMRLGTRIDPQRHQDVAARLRKQIVEAQWWRDACIAYFQSVSGLPLPEGVRKPPFPLEYYKARHFAFAPGNG